MPSNGVEPTAHEMSSRRMSVVGVSVVGEPTSQLSLKQEVVGVAEQSPAKPKNVVVVDADNPLIEIRGEFFWREDHDQILASAEEEAFRQGYTHGRADAAKAAPQRQEIALKYRPSFFNRLRRWVIGGVVLAGSVTLLVAVILDWWGSR